MHTQAIGEIGEKIAATYVRKKGYKLLAKNLKLGKLEIDLVAEGKKGRIHILEVKTILGDPETHKPEDNYNYQKSKNIRAAAQKFLGRYPDKVGEAGIQIDLIAINLLSEVEPENYKLRYYENL